MKNIVIAIVTLSIFSFLTVGSVSAQTYQPAPQPAPQVQPSTQQPASPATPGLYANVKNLRPFSAETAYMSLAGYLRYLTHQQTSQWLTRPEAERIVRQ